MAKPKSQILTCGAASPDAELHCALDENHDGPCSAGERQWNGGSWVGAPITQTPVDGTDAPLVAPSAKQLRLIVGDPNEILGRLRKKHAILDVQRLELEARLAAYKAQKKLVETIQDEQDELIMELLDAKGSVAFNGANGVAQLPEASPPEPVDPNDELTQMASEMQRHAGGMDEEGDEQTFGDEDEAVRRIRGVRSRVAAGDGPC